MHEVHAQRHAAVGGGWRRLAAVGGRRWRGDSGVGKHVYVGAPISVTDPDDERVALYRNLKDRDLRQRKGLFLAESEIVLERLLTSRFAVRSVFLHTQRLPRLDAALRSFDGPVYVAAAELMEAIAGFPVHRGVLALAERGPSISWRTVAAASGSMLVLERVGDPDNIGALFRMAAAFGYAGALLSPGTADPLYRKAIRSSMGWCLHLPFSELDDWPADLTALASLGRPVIALTPASEALDLHGLSSHALLANRDHALLVGAEGPGLSVEALAAASLHARIPMAATVDSLNVAVAAAIAMYELSVHTHTLTHRDVSGSGGPSGE